MLRLKKNPLWCHLPVFTTERGSLRLIKHKGVTTWGGNRESQEGGGNIK